MLFGKLARISGGQVGIGQWRRDGGRLKSEKSED